MENGSNFTYLNMNDILPNRFQPRIHFDDNKLNELAESIRKYGVIEPIIVRQIGNKYEIIAGERRFKASRLAGKSVIPTIVINLTDKESEEIALLENVQRQNLTPIEEAVSYKRILDMGYITQEELAKKLGKSQSTIANKIRLLNLDDEVQYALLNGKISERHARSLLRIHNNQDQVQMLNRIINERLTVKRTDDAIKELLEAPAPTNDKEIEELFATPLPRKPRRAVAVASHDIIKVNPPQEINERIKREEKNMDIDKIMQEAQDINVPSEEKDITGLMKQTPDSPSVLEGINNPQPAPEVTETPKPANNPDIPLVNDEQNKFVNFAGIAAENPAPTPAPAPAQPNTTSFDSMFNFTPTDLQQPAETPKPESLTMNDTPVETSTPIEAQTTMSTSQQVPLVEPSLNISEPAPTAFVKEEKPIVNNNAAIAAAVQRAINSDLPEKPVEPSLQPESPAMGPTANNQSLYNELVQSAPLVNEPQTIAQPAPTSVPIPPADILETKAPQTIDASSNFAEVIKIIRNCANEIEKMGYYIDVDEIDLQNSYQATFKINKDK